MDDRVETWGWSEDVASATWGTDWDYFSTADHIIITLYPSPCCIHEVSIVTGFVSRVNKGKEVKNELSVEIGL